MRESPWPRDRQKFDKAIEDVRKAMKRLRRAGADDSTMLGEAEFAIDQVIKEESK